MDRIVVLSASLLVMMCAGCGKEKPSYTGDLVEVSGRVTLDSEPLAGANIVFFPKSGESRHTAATTGEAGDYTLQTLPAGPGALPGEYDVVVSKLIMPDGSEVPPDAAPIDVGAEESVPGTYSNVGEPTLRAVVEAGKLNTIDFELVSKKK